MEPDDDRTTAEEIRLLREDQRTARSRAISALVVLTFVLLVVYWAWSGDREAEKIGDCFRRNLSTEQC